MKQLLTVLLSLLPLLVFSACSDNGSSNISDESSDDPALEESIDNSTTTDESFVSDTDDFESDTNTFNGTEEIAPTAQPSVESCASLASISQTQRLECELGFATQPVQ